MDLKKK